jgi:hypothetical protein
MSSALDLLKKVGYTIVNWNNIIGKPSSFTPSPHKSTHATGGSDEITPADIGAVNKAGDTMTGFLTIQRPGATLVVVNTDYTGTEKRVFFGADANGRLFLRALTGQGVVIRSSGDTTDLVTVDNTGLMKINGNTVWHAGNDGAGSGLDADMVDGVHVTGSGSTGLRKITTSTSSPSGGSDGDIWIQYS